MSRGELPGDADLELLIDLIVGPVYYRLLTRAGPVSLAPEGLVEWSSPAARRPPASAEPATTAARMLPGP